MFQSCRDGATASWVIYQYFRGVKCLAQGHNTAAVGIEPLTSRSGIRHSTTEPPRSPQNGSESQQNPYLASFCHSQALNPMISLACQIFSVQPHSACVLQQSSLCCALHVQTISSYWCGAPHLSPGCQAL